MVHLLLSNLDTPSQQVQEAIANCLPPLAPVIKNDADVIIPKLLEKVEQKHTHTRMPHNSKLSLVFFSF